MAISKIKKHTNQVPDYSNGTVYDTLVPNTNRVEFTATDDGFIVVNSTITHGAILMVNDTTINYLTPTYFGTSKARFHDVVPVKKGDIVKTYDEVEYTQAVAIPVTFFPNRRGG